jgi:hypothetical protein
MGRKGPGTMAEGRVVIGSKQYKNRMGRKDVCTRYSMFCNNYESEGRISTGGTVTGSDNNTWINKGSAEICAA